MAETKYPLEPTLPAKRKPELGVVLDLPNKTQKLQSITEPENSVGEAVANGGDVKLTEDHDGFDGGEVAEEENGAAERKLDRKGKGILIEKENENGVRERKGKGKGIMVEEEEYDNSDDSDDGDGDDDSSSDDSDDDDDLQLSDSELSDDPLMEVDLDNILPSRTRRLRSNPGVYIADDKNRHNNNNQDDDDDSDSDDPDA